MGGKRHSKRGLIVEKDIGIGDPIVVETVKGRRKRKKVQASTSIPLNVPCENYFTSKEEVSKNSSNIDINVSPEPSPTKAYAAENNGSEFSSTFMKYMPDTYEEGNLFTESFDHEFKKMEDDQSVFDWKPHDEW